MRLLALVVLVLVPAGVLASTGFRVGNGASGTTDMYAISTGWYYPVEAAAMVNPRHMHRTAELYDTPGTPLEWDAKYGSVSITMRGVGFPMSGMNEKGLMIQAAILKGLPQVHVSEGGLPSTQWLQYQLDMSATVDDIIASAVTGRSPVVCIGTGKYNTQFEACDGTQCATFAFHDGKAIVQGTMGRVERVLGGNEVHRDTAQVMPVGAIGNREVGEALATYARCKQTACPALDFADQRFNLAFDAASKYAAQHPASSNALVEQVFTDLATLDQGAPLTTWNEIYERDPKTGAIRISYKSPKRPFTDLQWIAVTSSYDCRAPIDVWWLDMNHAGGDQTPQKKTLDASVRERLASQHAAAHGGTDDAKVFARARDYATTHMRCNDAPSGKTKK